MWMDEMELYREQCETKVDMTFSNLFQFVFTLFLGP